jgi:L-cysteine S-thiosulfotransferase
MRTGILFSVVGSVSVIVLAVGYAQVAAPGPWKSRAIPEAQGQVKGVDGKKIQVRYKEEPFDRVQREWSQWRTYAYNDSRPEPPVQKVSMPKDVKGDAKLGRKLFMDRAKGPCTGCHLIQGDDVWPAGNIGPDLSVYGDRLLPDEFVYQMIYDPRLFFPKTAMPPWGTVGIFKPEEIVHLLAFLKTQKGNPPFVPPAEKDPARNPFMRKQTPNYLGDNLDPTNNLAVLGAENAQALWSKRGPAGKACADCHRDGPEKSMKGVATRYPKYVPKYQRVMSIEDFLTVHVPETTGLEMLSESVDNLNMTILIKMQSNGMRVNLDLKSPEMKAALVRGKALYEKKVGMRNHACADCHTNAPGKGANKFLGGRLLDDVEAGLTNHFPLWWTARGSVWDIRKRIQWCMLPIGMNYLPADSVEYAELELYLTSLAHGKPMNVPGIR